MSMSFKIGRRLLMLMLALGAIGSLMCLPIYPNEEDLPMMRTEALDLSGFSAESPRRPLRLLFIHHSCGGQWLAPIGPDRGEHCIYESAANGGGLREQLTAAGYEVHEASYGSQIGDKTDIFDWPPKFRDQMQQILDCDRQDSLYSDVRRNEIVMFKSCFPNSLFIGPGQPPGQPQGPELTVENAKAAYRELLPLFEKHPDTVFIAISAPPLVLEPSPLYKVLAKRLLGRPSVKASGPYARQFNDWLKDPNDGWLKSYRGTNVVVFDLYDILTDGGTSNFLQYGSGTSATDNHPSAEGNRKATEAFVPFLNRAVRRAGIID
jgi:hypothetical protein